MANCFKRFLMTALALGLFGALPTAARGQTADTLRYQIVVSGTVTAVDHAARSVTIRGAQGDSVTLDVPTSVARFDQVQVGDTITAKYYDRVAVRMKPAGEPPVNRTVPPATTLTPGLLPGAVYASQRIATVTVTAWDPATRTVTFSGAPGTSYTRRVADDVDLSGLAGLTVGDRVDLTWTEAVEITMQAAPTSYADDDDFRHRFTLSVQWGWDNQFSGKMIAAASGQTTGGLGIDLPETTFDDVYGRMGLFKIGAGYRTSPRSETVLNYVYSKSGADNPVNVGTISAANIPLYVDFTDYSYWGFEGGQRFFFTRVRFTPYVGYLIGINRHTDIRGTFVNVPASLTPGLAAQDGKFFEKSWAFSFGPTGGVLVGVGPIEVMAETQLRYLGGLSDVDWLVEEGLRDINSESSRWSFPVLLGARIRF